MSLSMMALFLHVSEAVGACMSIGVWLFDLAAMLRARRVEQMRAIAWLTVIVSPFMVRSVLLIGLAGFHMAPSTCGLQTPWIAVALVSFVLIAPVNPFVLDAACGLSSNRRERSRMARSRMPLTSEPMT